MVDPLHHYLAGEILPQLGYYNAPVKFRVYRLGERDSIYLYEEIHSGIRVVGKFFAGHYESGSLHSQHRMDREFDNLVLLRSLGFTGYPHHVVRPLGRNAWLSSVLIEEFNSDSRLSRYIEGAIRDGQGDELRAKLTSLAYFLASIHNRTANGYGVDFSADCRYMDRVVGKLRWNNTISEEEASELGWLRDRWAEQPRMWEDQQVLVHGDATPANFLFGDGLQVTAIDLEAMKRADRVFDVGRIAGELQHSFLQARGNKYEAEPFIGHFLWEYSCHFPDRDQAFASISRRVPFQMALTLLRIARNDWINPEHRRHLVDEAKTTLRTF